MADAVLILAGLALVAAIYLDALATTLTVGGAGVLTRTVMVRLWRVLLRVTRPDSGSRLLTGAGAGLLLTTVLVWVAGLWAGWSLIFLGSDTVVDAQTLEPAGPVDVAYYAGFTVFTLGVGDFVASAQGSRVLTAFASFAGLFLITLAITYLLSVVSAVVERRAVAVRINALGDTAHEIAVNGWTGESFSSAFIQQLVALTGQVATTAERHLAYPVLHYFRPRDRQAAAPIAIGQLDDAMLLLQSAVAPAAQPDNSAVAPVRRAIGRYLETASPFAVTPVPAAPPLPDRMALSEAGIPVNPSEDVARRMDAEADHRSRLHQLVQSGGWSWPSD